MSVQNTKIEIPSYIRENYCFGDTFQQMIEESINLRTQSLPPENIIALNNIFSKMDSKHRALEESIQIMSSPKTSIKFWNTILESKNLSDFERNQINSIKAILEDDSQNTQPTQSNSKPPKREAIEGDGEDPNADDNSEQPSNSGNDQGGTDDQQDPNDPNNQGDGSDQDPNDPNNLEASLQPDQVLQLELTQTNNKFMILTLYDKINELIDTIEVILDTVSSSKSEENLDLFESLKLYQSYLNIIAELVFVMDINTVYYNFTNISIEVNDLLDKYLIASKVKILNDDKSTPQEKKNVIEDLRQNLASKIEANDEIQDEGND